MTTKVKEILAKKDAKVVCISQNKTVHEAIKILVNHNIGAVLVLDKEEKLVGIFTERDILKQTVRRSNRLKDTFVNDVMTTDLIIGLPEDDNEYLMGVMTSNKVRHIPILENGTVVGIISIGDLVKAQLHDVQFENRYLKDYILGKYPA
jgi:CBS domain-containing protein